MERYDSCVICYSELQPHYFSLCPACSHPLCYDCLRNIVIFHNHGSHFHSCPMCRVPLRLQITPSGIMNQLPITEPIRNSIHPRPFISELYQHFAYIPLLEQPRLYGLFELHCPHCQNHVSFVINPTIHFRPSRYQEVVEEIYYSHEDI